MSPTVKRQRLSKVTLPPVESHKNEVVLLYGKFWGGKSLLSNWSPSENVIAVSLMVMDNCSSQATDMNITELDDSKDQVELLLETWEPSTVMLFKSHKVIAPLQICKENIRKKSIG